MIHRRTNLLRLLSALAITLFSFPAAAYVGPGAGLSAIGTVVALVLVVIVAVLGFLWYPLKRLFGKKNAQQDDRVEDDTDLPVQSSQSDN